MRKFGKDNIKDSKYYSLDIKENVERCKTDEEYLGEVILANENLIWHSVHKYIGKPEMICRQYGIEKDDILQLGRVGFLKAVKAFDPDRGVKFSSFAVTAIVREIRCFLRDSAKIIRPTRSANNLINRINKIEHELGYLPSIKDLAAILGEDEEKIEKAIRIGRSVRYLDEPISKKNDTNTITLLDTLNSGIEIEDDVLDRIYIDSILEKVKDRLSEKELRILQHRINGLTNLEVAEQENLSKMIVNQIMKKVARLIEEQSKEQLKG